MPNKTIRTFNYPTTWTCPAEVTVVKIISQRIISPVQQNTNPALNMCALSNNGRAYCWGSGGQGYNGNGTITSYSSPVAVVGGLTFSQVYSGYAPLSYSNYGLTANGNLYAWGSNTYGQLGNATNVAASSPVLVLGGLSFQQITSTSWDINGAATVFGIVDSADLYAWGSNASGQCGNGTSTSAFSSPVLVVGGLKWQYVASAGDICFGITTSGALYAWGSNYSGVLGVNTQTAAYSSPVLVVGGLTFSQILSTGQGNSQQATMMALTIAGDMYAWGNGSSTTGFIGTGSLTSASSPTIVVGGIRWKTPVNQNFLQVSVVPGTTYTITFQQPYINFGSYAIPYGQQLQIEYDG